MIEVKLNEDAGIVTVVPSTPLHKEDFTHLANEVDPYIEKEGKLKGLIIQVK